MCHSHPSLFKGAEVTTHHHIRLAFADGEQKLVVHHVVSARHFAREAKEFDSLQAFVDALPEWETDDDDEDGDAMRETRMTEREWDGSGALREQGS